MINLIDIADNEWEWETFYFDLRHISKNIWIGTEINLLTVTFRFVRIGNP